MNIYSFTRFACGVDIAVVFTLYWDSVDSLCVCVVLSADPMLSNISRSSSQQSLLNNTCYSFYILLPQCAM